jgi:hypothetical protein
LPCFPRMPARHGNTDMDATRMSRIGKPLLALLVRSFSTTSRPALRAAFGRPPARQGHDRSPGYRPHPPPRWNHTHQAIPRDGTDGGLGHHPPSGSGQLPHPSRPLPEDGHRQSHARAILSRVQLDVSVRPRLAPSPRYPQPGRHAPWPRQPLGHPDQRASGARARLPARSRPLPPPSERPAPAAPCSAPAPARLAGAHRSCRCQGPP